MFSHLILITTLRDGHYYLLFTEEETEVLRSKMICPRLQACKPVHLTRRPDLSYPKAYSAAIPMTKRGISEKKPSVVTKNQARVNQPTNKCLLITHPGLRTELL